MNLEKRMKKEVKQNLDVYLDSARCLNCTMLAEIFINEDEPHDEEFYFEVAADVEEWARKCFDLNN